MLSEPKRSKIHPPGSVLALTPFLGIALLAALIQFSPWRAQAQSATPQIDYSGFQQMTSDLASYREGRIISLDAFHALSKRNEAIILDTRSREAFEQGHWKGAVHLNFADFSQEKLDRIVGSRDRPILIYCNNNFTDNVEPVRLKRAELALNIPTFISLHGYGFANIYELGGVTNMTELGDHWITNQNTTTKSEGHL